MPERTLNILKQYALLLSGLLALIFAISWGPLFFSGADRIAEGKRISRVFEAKEKLLRDEMEVLAARITSAKTANELWLAADNGKLGKSGLYFTVSAEDSLVYWSSSLVSFDSKFLPAKPDGMLKKMSTGSFYIFSRQAGKYTITGYMLIKRDFPLPKQVCPVIISTGF